MRNNRNALGLKDSINMYRTVNGERYIQWSCYFDANEAELLRAAGVKVRKFVGELFIREADAGVARGVAQ